MKKLTKKMLVSTVAASALLATLSLCSGWTSKEKALAYSDGDATGSLSTDVETQDPFCTPSLDELAAAQDFGAQSLYGTNSGPAKKPVLPHGYRTEYKYETIYGRVGVGRALAHSQGGGTESFHIEESHSFTVSASLDFSAGINNDWVSAGISAEITQSTTITDTWGYSATVESHMPTGIYHLEAFVKGKQYVKYVYEYKDLTYSQLISTDRIVIGTFAPLRTNQYFYGTVGYALNTTNVVYSSVDINNTVLNYKPNDFD